MNVFTTKRKSPNNSYNKTRLKLATFAVNERKLLLINLIRMLRIFNHLDNLILYEPYWMNLITVNLLWALKNESNEKEFNKLCLDFVHSVHGELCPKEKMTCHLYNGLWHAVKYLGKQDGRIKRLNGILSAYETILRPSNGTVETKIDNRPPVKNNHGCQR